MPESDQKLFLITRLFANWVAHIEITRSNTGLRILSTINSALVSIKDSADTVAIQTNISEAIGFPALRKELELLFDHIEIDDVLVSNNYAWAIFISHLIEIIRDVPLSFPKLSVLDTTKRKIYEEISQNPIKPGAGVIAVQISLIDNATLGPKEPGDTMCLLIRTEDTTTIVVPLLIDARV